MIIDFHTHMFPEKIAGSTIAKLAPFNEEKPTTDGTILGLLKAMEEGNCDLAITLPVLTKPSQYESVTKFTIETNQQFKGKKIIAFGGIHPLCENIFEKMKYLKDNGIKGVKIHPDYQGEFIDHEGYIEILESAKKLDMIVITHSGIDGAYLDQPERCPPDRLVKVIDRVKYNKFVLAHYGAKLQWEEVLELIAGKDVYLDTACMLRTISFDLFNKILLKHGEDKILFATDCPWSSIKLDSERLNSFNLSKETKDKIFYKNALKLLGLKNEY